MICPPPRYYTRRATFSSAGSCPRALRGCLATGSGDAWEARGMAARRSSSLSRIGLQRLDARVLHRVMHVYRGRLLVGRAPHGGEIPRARRRFSRWRRRPAAAATRVGAVARPFGGGRLLLDLDDVLLRRPVVLVPQRVRFAGGGARRREGRRRLPRGRAGAGATRSRTAVDTTAWATTGPSFSMPAWRLSLSPSHSHKRRERLDAAGLNNSLNIFGDAHQGALQ